MIGRWDLKMSGGWGERWGSSRTVVSLYHISVGGLAERESRYEWFTSNNQNTNLTQMDLRTVNERRESWRWVASDLAYERLSADKIKIVSWEQTGTTAPIVSRNPQSEREDLAPREERGI